jgi:type IV pilus biogenesis protein CpaD/CtpE
VLSALLFVLRDWIRRIITQRKFIFVGVYSTKNEAGAPVTVEFLKLKVRFVLCGF